MEDAANLDDELGIPNDATLVASTPVRLLLTSSQAPDDSPHLITFSAPISNANDQGAQGSSSTSLSAGLSMRGETARSIVVGRQASAADIRIDHKSVSRRHTALYYTHRAAPALIVRDLGGKHGTHVDGARVAKGGVAALPLREGGEHHVLRFGKAPLECRVIIPVAEAHAPPLGDQTSGANAVAVVPSPQQSTLNLVEESNDEQNSAEHAKDTLPLHEPETKLGSEDNTEADVPSTRETREAQIAAMVASLDSDPVYRKFVPQDGESDVMKSTFNRAADARSKYTVITKNGTGNMPNNNAKGKSNKYNLPITDSIILSPGFDSFNSSDGTAALQANAAVSTLCFEPSGARIVAGHRDGTLRFYDFHGMRAPTSGPSTSSGKTCYPPFRIVDSDNDPLDDTGRHIITALGSCAGGGQWIVGTTSAQPKVLDREGRTTLFYFIKGDTYVTNASATKGHTASVTGVAFHPLVKDVCWTCGLDGSIRQWDVSGRGRTDFKKLVCQKVIGKCKNEKGQRTQTVSNLSVHPGGRKIAVGTACGSVQIWNCFGSGTNDRPLAAVYSAHGGTAKPVNFVAFSGSGARIATRSESDDTVRIWDASLMEKTGVLGWKFRSEHKKEGMFPPSLVAICNGVLAFNESANAAFGPDGTIICAGSSIDHRARKSAESGKVKFYKLPEEERSKTSRETMSKSSSKNKKTVAILDPIEEVAVSPDASVLVVQWHPKLNQIAVGTSNGIIQILYDPNLSTKGAVIPTSRIVRQSDGLSELLRSRAPTGSAAYINSSDANIIVPNALPLFREEPRATRKSRENERRDPEKTRLPDPPVTGGIKTGGGMGGGVTFSQYIVESTNYVNNKNIAGKDPREELFKYNEGKNYVSKAYEGDIQKILAEKTVEEEEAELKAGKRQKTK